MKWLLPVCWAVVSNGFAWQDAGQAEEPAIVVPGFDVRSFSVPPGITITRSQMRQLVATLRQRRILRLSLADHPEVDDEVIQPLKEFPLLKELNLHGTGIHDGAAASLASLTALESLDLSETMVGNDGLNAVKGLRHLKKLHLRSTRVDDEGLAALKDLKSLRDLNLNSTALRGTGLAHLKALKLRSLDLGDTRLAADSLGPLRSMMTLETIHLNNTRINNEGLAALRWLPHLRLLNVSCAEVTDAALQPFLKRPGFECLNVCPDR